MDDTVTEERTDRLAEIRASVSENSPLRYLLDACQWYSMQRHGTEQERAHFIGTEVTGSLERWAGSDIPWLLAEVDRLRAALQQSEAELEFLRIIASQVLVNGQPALEMWASLQTLKAALHVDVSNVDVQVAREALEREA